VPTWKSNVRATYTSGGFSASLNWSRIGQVTDQALADRATGIEPKVGDEHYFDLGLRYDTKAGFEIFGGVQNLTNNEAPSILTGFTSANSDLTTYDGIGRAYFIGAKMKF